MPAKAEKLSLFLFIDAFGWEIKQRHPWFLQDLIRDSKPLETILGYSSACDPSIISGLTPGEHKLWSSFYYDPEGCPFTWARHFRILPGPLLQRARVRRQLGKIIKKCCGFTGYFQLYNIPFNDLPLFNYAEKKRIWEPGGLPVGETIFDRLAGQHIPYHVHDSNKNDQARLAELMSDIQNQRVAFAYSSLGQLDALMHARGNDHPDIGKLLHEYDNAIRTLLDAARENYDEVSWYIFTDHGMHNVTEAYDLAADIEPLNLEWNVDYAAFYDATMARFWLMNERSRQAITRCLGHHPKGRILSKDELQGLGVWFEDGQYGDLIFLMHSGIQIAPGFMGTKPMRGAHGYHPTDPDSFASLSSNRPIPESVTGIRHMHQLMLSELNLD